MDKLRNKLNNWSFHAKKSWIYGLFRVKTTLNQRFLSMEYAIQMYSVRDVSKLDLREALKIVVQIG